MLEDIRRSIRLARPAFLASSSLGVVGVDDVGPAVKGDCMPERSRLEFDRLLLTDAGLPWKLGEFVCAEGGREGDLIEGEKSGASRVKDCRLPLNEVLRSEIEFRPSLMKSLITFMEDLRSFFVTSCGCSLDSLLIFLASCGCSFDSRLSCIVSFSGAGTTTAFW